MSQPQPLADFLRGYFLGLRNAVTSDPDTFTVALFGVFASLGFGIFRGITSALGLYAILRLVTNSVNSLALVIYESRHNNK